MRMVIRQFWIDCIEAVWKKRSIVWLTGVRRAGKTTLCRDLSDIDYFDCELPRNRKLLEDPEGFLKEYNGRRIALDEIHRLRNPSELLKIAADYFPKTLIIATGSSSLSASKKFSDTLTGRKLEIHLSPINSLDMNDFKKPSLPHRLHFGGLPPFFLADSFPEPYFQEWIDSFWAKDIQEIFGLQKREAFQKFFELIFVNSGGIFEATSFAASCEINRATVNHYLNVLTETSIARIVRPFSKHKPSEITRAPKIYGFDTGFVCFFKGWAQLRPDDFGILWEHFVLNEMMSRLQTITVSYWRTKQKKEIDFIVTKRSGEIFAIECKWKYRQVDTSAFAEFSRYYPSAKLIVVAQDVERPFKQKKGNIELSVVSLEGLLKLLF